jgi:hypothetical protein
MKCHFHSDFFVITNPVGTRVNKTKQNKTLIFLTSEVEIRTFKIVEYFFMLKKRPIGAGPGEFLFNCIVETMPGHFSLILLCFF